MRRRAFGRVLLACGALAAVGCAGMPGQSSVVLGADGAPVPPAQALASLRQAEHLLLGELHDNPLHHRERARLIEALAARRPIIVFEQLANDADAVLAEPASDGLDAWLERAGFDRKGWGWPLHRPLFEAALGQGLAVRGGNLPRDQVRRIAREGLPAAPPALRERLEAGLPPAAADVLDRALRDGHCGRLPETLLPRLRLAQTARDIAMSDALLRAAQAGGGATVLIAGNGHVRRDHGVPLWLERAQPGARVLSVGFLERGADGTLPGREQTAAHDLVWVTARVEREDPCRGLAMPDGQR